MKIKITGNHDFYAKGEHEVEEGRGIYLKQIGLAEDVIEKKKVDLPKSKTDHKKK